MGNGAGGGSSCGGGRRSPERGETHTKSQSQHYTPRTLTYLIYETQERKRVESYFKFSFLSACRPGKTNRPEAERMGIY